MCTPQSAIAQIQDTCAFLEQTDDLSPHNDGVNSRLSEFVSCVGEWHGCGMAAHVLDKEVVAHEQSRLPELCGMAECEMEKFWTKELLKDKDLKNGGLKNFWYYKNYENLCRAEHDLIDMSQYSSISFLGSGALPLTAYFASEFCPHAHIKCIDCDCNACELSLDLMKALGLKDRIDVIQSDVMDYQPTDGELVICASLLSNHDGLYAQLKKNGVNSLMVRDAEDVFQFLYKPAMRPDSGFVELAKTIPTIDRVNTTRFYQEAA